MKNHHQRKPSKVRFDLNLFRNLVELDLGSSLCLRTSELLPPDAGLRADASPHHYFASRQLEALTKKNVDAPGHTADTRVAAAMQKFEDAEYSCYLYNVRKNKIDISSPIALALGESKRLARDILGPLDSSTYKRICGSVMFGSGMTFSDTCKSDTSLAMKLKGVQSVTKGLVPYLPALKRENPLMWDLFDLERVELVRGNRVTTVPKTAEVDRTIAIEPSFNMLFQRGIDVVMRQKLKRYGVDLSDQTAGWEPARLGSIDGSYATIDLSSASDLISIEVVREFLDPEWFALLDDVRSKEYTCDKGQTWRTYHKFSSMGNSFTFPLESLIFFAVASTCTALCGSSQRAIVYGDDIVVPREAYCLTFEVLQALGFTVNPEKSFATGRFRETCGHDYHCGVDVRPIYVKSNPRTEIDVYNLYNRFLNNRQGIVYHNALAYLYGLVSKPLIQPRYWSPGVDWERWTPLLSSIYDAGFMVPRSVAEQYVKRTYHSDFQAMCYKFTIWRSRQAQLRHPWEEIYLFLSCYAGSHTAYDNGRVYYALRRVTVTRWHDDGQWPNFLFGG